MTSILRREQAVPRTVGDTANDDYADGWIRGFRAGQLRQDETLRAVARLGELARGAALLIIPIITLTAVALVAAGGIR